VSSPSRASPTAPLSHELPDIRSHRCGLLAAEPDQPALDVVGLDTGRLDRVGARLEGELEDLVGVGVFVGVRGVEQRELAFALDRERVLRRLPLAGGDRPVDRGVNVGRSSPNTFCTNTPPSSVGRNAVTSASPRISALPLPTSSTPTVDKNSSARS
jgi:hypothetical protein